MIVGIIPTNDPSITASTYVNLSDRPYSKLVTANIYKGTTKISHYMSTGKLNGLKNHQVETLDATYGADFGQYPTNEWYWWIYMATNYPGGNASYTWGATGSIKVTFYCKLRDRIQL